MTRRPCVARITVGIRIVVKIDVVPTACAVAVRTLTRPVAVWRGVAGQTVGEAAVVEGHFPPVGRAVAL